MAKKIPASLHSESIFHLLFNILAAVSGVQELFYSAVIYGKDMHIEPVASARASHLISNWKY